MIEFLKKNKIEYTVSESGAVNVPGYLAVS